MNSKTNLLEEYLQEVVKGPQQHRRLWVFDFDDTLVLTDCVTHVTTADGKRFDLTPGGWAVYDKKPGDTFDHSDFLELVNPRAIGWTNQILRHVHDFHGPECVVILSARSSANPIRKYMSGIGLTKVEVVALDSSDPHRKALWISARILRDDIKEVEFLDDSHKNVAAVSDLRHAHPKVSISARHIDHSNITSLRHRH